MDADELPISSQSIAGYMIYWMNRGWSPEQALQRAKLFPRFGRQSEQTFNQALLYAVEAQSLTSEARLLQDNPEFRPGALSSPLAAGVYGLRLFWEQVDVAGNVTEQSVVINVGPYATMAQIQAEVDRIAFGGITRPSQQSPLAAVSITPVEIYQVMPGGYGSEISTLGM